MVKKMRCRNLGYIDKSAFGSTVSVLLHPNINNLIRKHHITVNVTKYFASLQYSLTMHSIQVNFSLIPQNHYDYTLFFRLYIYITFF